MWVQFAVAAILHYYGPFRFPWLIPGFQIYWRKAFNFTKGRGGRHSILTDGGGFQEGTRFHRVKRKG